MTLQEIKEKLQKIADKKVLAIYEWCGGNVDDAYQMGLNDGEIWAARETLAELEKLG